MTPLSSRRSTLRNPQLFGEAAPRAAENFYELCAREKYAGSQIYKVVSPYNIQGGDIAGSGDKCVKEKSCVSAFGGPFQPEGYEIEHSVSGHGRYCARAPTPTSFWYEKKLLPAHALLAPACRPAELLARSRG